MSAPAQADAVFTVTHLVRSYLAERVAKVTSGEIEPATLYWERVQLGKLTKAHGDHAAAKLLASDLTPKLTNAFVRSLKTLYRWGADPDVQLVPRDPFRRLATPRCGQRQRELTKPELRRLYLASSRALRRLLFVQLHTTARPGEIRNLVWDQIDWEEGVIVLQKFKGQKRRRVRLAARAIPLPPYVLRLLRNLFRRSPDQTPDGRVFRSPRANKPWTPNGVRCAMRRARERAGMNDGGERVVCYHLRHKAATIAVRMGMPLKELAEIMGHTRVTTTERYVHLNTKDLVRSTTKLAAAKAAAREAAKPPKPQAG